jgi:DNA invertase Pin-like site-specific DNA recombinase
MYRMLAAIAEFQRDLIVTNTRERLAAARAPAAAAGASPSSPLNGCSWPNSSTTPKTTPSP